MKRSLRSSIRLHALRAFAILSFCLLSNISFGQLSGCPDQIVNIMTGNPTACQADYSVTGITTASTNPITWLSTGATVNAMADIDDPTDGLEVGQTFEYGVTQIVISDGVESCMVALVVTESTPVPTDICDDVTVDIAGICISELVLADDVDLSGDITCEPMDMGDVEITWDGVAEKTLMLTEADILVTTPRTVYFTKSMNQAVCMKNVVVVDSTVPSIDCPTDATVEVAPTCLLFYTYDVESTAVIPCGGSLTQTAGDPSNTPLGPGSYPYAYDFLDAGGMPITPCAWNITVIESANAGAQVACLSQINVSLDQACEALIEPASLMTGSVCGDISLFSVSATLTGGTELSGPNIIFTQDHLGMDIEVSVLDPNGVNSCWGTVTIEDKLAPVIICPIDLTVSCTMPTDTSATGLPSLDIGTLTTLQFDAATISNGSCTVEIFFRDAVQNNLCEGPFQRVISRTWWAIDDAGNRSLPCVQTISVTREDLSSTTFPPHWDGQDMHSGIMDNGVTSNPPLACDGAGTVWAADTLEDGRIIPSPFDEDMVPGTGQPGDVGSCGTIFSFYEDIIIDICNDNCSNYNGSYKVLRTWDVFDWCTGEFVLHEQSIKVLDTVPPVFTDTVPDMTVSTDIWNCGATIYLPEVSAIDQCSSDISYYWSVTGGSYDPVANTVFVASNAITTPGNEVELIATAEDCCGNLAYDTAYVTIVDLVPPVVVADEHTVVSLNNQEDDGSTKVHVDSFDDGSFDGCGPVDWWIRRMDSACEYYDGLDADGNPTDTEPDEVNDFHKYIHFCCDDVDSLQRVIFMVCDDADGNGIPEMDTDDNCSTAMIIVDVQDKLAPTIVCPQQTTINCIDFVAFENYLDIDLDEEGSAKLDSAFGEAYTTSTCGVLGEQTFTLVDELCGFGEATRSFVVTSSNGQATCSQTIFIEPDAGNLLTCDRISFPTLSESPYNYSWCDPTDAIAPFVTPVIVEGCGDVNIEEPVIDRDNLCTQVGITVTLDTFNFASGGCMKILAHWEVIDQCIFVENYFHDGEEVDPFVTENGYYEIYVEYDIFDNEGPIVACDSLLVETADCEVNNDIFSISPTDECTPDESISVVYKVDFGDDGTFDYPADTSFAEGRSFDASLLGGLPIGEHAIRWVTYDGCGNYTICVQHIEVVRRIKQPTPYCHLGLSSAVMDSINGCNVELWASDFVPNQSTGACGEALEYVMIPYQDIFGDPADPSDDLSVEDAFDLAEPNWTFGCEYIEDGVSHVIDIRVYAVDENGVYDFCDASLTLNDNFDCCTDLDIGGTVTSIGGNVITHEGELLHDIDVMIESNQAEFPRITSTSAQGTFMFHGITYENDYQITASKNDDTKNGVSTLDLVLIQRHILGMTILDSPYKIIAADINGNESISAVDLLQLRKLILGLYPDDQLPNNQSWRFLDNSYEFVDNEHPFPFNEIIHVNNVSQAMYNQNFVAVKVGDVNGSISLSQNNNAQNRNTKAFNIYTLDQNFEKGELVTVSFFGEDVAAFFGMQMSIAYDEKILSFDNLQGEGVVLGNDNIGVQNGLVSMSYSNAELLTIPGEDALFTMTFKAKKAGKLSGSMDLSNILLNAEVYNKTFEAEEIKLNFRTVEEKGFELMQNEPNPFQNNTSISFVLPQAGNASLKVFDVTGKVLVNKSKYYEKGLNSIVIYGNELHTNGILYYQLEYNDHRATRKMILLD